jgi:hypothetical protein
VYEGKIVGKVTSSTVYTQFIYLNKTTTSTFTRTGWTFQPNNDQMMSIPWSGQGSLPSVSPVPLGSQMFYCINSSYAISDSAKTLAMLMAVSKPFKNIIQKNKPSQNKLDNAKRRVANLRRIITSTKPFHGYRELNRHDVKNAIHLHKQGKINFSNYPFVYQNNTHESRHPLGNNSRAYHLYRTGNMINEIKKMNKPNIRRNNDGDIEFTNARDPNKTYTLYVENGRLYSFRRGQGHTFLTGIKAKNILSTANLAKV